MLFRSKGAARCEGDVLRRTCAEQDSSGVRAEADVEDAVDFRDSIQPAHLTRGDLHRWIASGQGALQDKEEPVVLTLQEMRKKGLLQLRTLVYVERSPVRPTMNLKPFLHRCTSEIAA